MNIHFLPDNGFMDAFIENFEKVYGHEDNIYLIVSGLTPWSLPIKKRVKNNKVITLKYNSAEFKKLTVHKSVQVNLFIHYLTNEACNFINTYVRSNYKVFWMFWGADMFMPVRYFKTKIYDEISIEYLKHNHTFVKTGNKFYDAIKAIKRSEYFSLIDIIELRNRQKAISRVDVFCHYNKYDYILLKTLYNTKAIFKEFFYYEFDYSSLDIILNKSSQDRLRQEIKLKNKLTIVLGNSASLSNNHISIIKLLASYDSSKFQVVCPLSYGDAKYGNYVAEYGRKVLGNNFIILDKYLPKEDYLNFLNITDYGFYNHCRTEAAGNVFLMLTLNKKVFLNSNSNLLHYLKDNQVSIFDIASGLSDDISTSIADNDRHIKLLFSQERAIYLMKHII